MYTPSGNNRWFGQSKNHENRLKELFSSFVCHVYRSLLMRTPLNFFECPSILVSEITYLPSRCVSLHLPTRLHGKVYYTLHTTAPGTAIFHRDLRYCMVQTLQSNLPLVIPFICSDNYLKSILVSLIVFFNSIE